MDRRPVVQWIGIVAVCAAIACIWTTSRGRPDEIAPLAGVDPIAIERGSVDADYEAREATRSVDPASIVEPAERSDRIAGTNLRIACARSIRSYSWTIAARMDAAGHHPGIQ